MRQILLQNATASLLQNASGFLLQTATILLQNTTILLQSVTVIAKCDVHHKLRQYNLKNCLHSRIILLNGIQIETIISRD